MTSAVVPPTWGNSFTSVMSATGWPAAETDSAARW